MGLEPDQLRLLERQHLGLVRSGAVCIAYETVTDARGALPLLAPMSEVAGRMSVHVGAHCLEKEQGGAGVLLGALAFMLCALAPTYPWLLAARVLQGVAVALTLSCAPALATALLAGTMASIRACRDATPTTLSI